MNDIEKAYREHRNSAKQRKIKFNLTFNQWLRIWIDSGHLHERGAAKDQYVMARHGDKGAYTVGNVKIIKCSENVIERNVGAPKDTVRRRIMRKLGLSQ